MTGHMDCREAAEDFGALLDNELSPQRREAVEAHLAECSDCLRDLERLQRVDRLYQGVAPVAAPAGFEDGVYRAAHPSIFRRRRGQRPVWPLIAAAAVMAVAAGTLFTLLLREPNRFEMAAAPEISDSRTMRTIEMIAGQRAPKEDLSGDSGTVPPPASPEAVPAPQMVAFSAPVAATGGDQAAPRQFERRGDVWAQQGYADQPLTVLATHDELDALGIDAALREQLQSLTPPVVFEFNGRWYTIRKPLTADG